MNKPAARLFVHGRQGTIEIPETGDTKSDELLERICRRAGAKGGFAVTTASGEIYVGDPDKAARDALRDGA